jgi:hypothetical protein
MKKGIFLLIVFYSVQVFAAIYHWVDQNGVTHYSDVAEPGTGAKAYEVHVAPAQPVTQGVNPAGSNGASQNSTPPTDSANAASFNGYQSLTLKLVNGSEDGNVQDPSGEVQLDLDLKPTLQAGDGFVVNMDGRNIGEVQTGNQITLSNVERGEHAVKVFVVNKDQFQNKKNNEEPSILKESNALTIYVHRPMIKKEADS